MAFKYHPVIPQGATFDRTLTYSAGTPKQPVILTGCSAIATFRDFTTNAVLFVASTANGRVILGGAAGTVRFLLPPAVTLPLWVKATYNLDLTYPDSRVQRLFEGVARMTRSSNV